MQLRYCKLPTAVLRFAGYNDPLSSAVACFDTSLSSVPSGVNVSGCVLPQRCSVLYRSSTVSGFKLVDGLTVINAIIPITLAWTSRQT